MTSEETKTKRAKNPKIKKRVKIAVLLITAVFAVSLAASVLGMFRYRNPLTKYGLPYEFTQNGQRPKDITVDGRAYAYNDDIVSVLFTGYDDTWARERSGIGFQADTIMLAAVNRKTGGVKILSVPRDTLTDVAVFDFGGVYAATQKLPVAVSRSYGREEPFSNDLTMAAVSNLLYQVPIGRYFAMNIDGIAFAADAVGGVELQLLEDFTSHNPNMKEGALYTLKGIDAEVYVRARQLSGMSGENMDRMSRQTQFIEAFARELKDTAKQNPLSLFGVMNAVKSYTQTNLGGLEIIYLALRLSDTDFSFEDVVTIPGQTVGSEYIADEKALKQLVLDTFFTEIG